MSKPTGFRKVVATGAAIALAASLPLLGGVGANAAEDDRIDLRAALAAQYEPGLYIVEVKGDPVATYEGGVSAFSGTADEDGQVDFTSAESQAYAAHLEDVQQEVAADAGVASVQTQLTSTINGFIADLTSEQAANLALSPKVSRLTPNEMLELQGVPATDFLELEEAFADEFVGGWEGAGEGVVVGILDTGIAPENPFFAGEELAAAGNPRLEVDEDGNDVIVYDKGNGDTFTGVCEAGEQFSGTECNDKIVGAQYFSLGFGDARVQGGPDVLSPRDTNGHGSHVGSTAAGNSNVDVTSMADIYLGQMSGVAPEAKIAAYKVCWDESADSGGCALIDLVMGIDQATQDGVDVINFSIGGGAATSVWEPIDQAFLGANAAGVFVSASAGNSGPDASTADHASPWYANVAASTVPNYEGRVTIEGGEGFNGASAMMIGQPDVTGELVYGGAIPAEDADASDSALCLPGSLDAAEAEGKLVLCDRGVNARAEKSQVAGEAGAIGLVHVNVQNDSLDLDDHAIPTVHVQNTYRDTLLAAAAEGATVTLSEVALEDVTTPAPQVAGFSSRGPMLASGSDILKPDFAAPGVGIIAAGPNYEGEDPTFVFMSGTSMAAPHAAGLGAAYMSANRDASPAQTISVLTTTTIDTVDNDGNPITDVFTQGAGNVSPVDMFNAGFYFDANLADYAAYLAGTGEVEIEGLEPIDPSDLNVAAIGIGELGPEQTVTRTATAITPGSYTVAIDAPAGVDVTVEPAVLNFTEAGQEISYEVTFTVTDVAYAGDWTQGRLVWSGPDGIEVRQPLGVNIVTFVSADRIDSDQATAEESLEAYALFNGAMTSSTYDLVEVETLWDGAPGVPGEPCDAGDDYCDWEDGLWHESLYVEEGLETVIVQTGADDAVPSDYDLTVAYFTLEGALAGVWDSLNEGSSEFLRIDNPGAEGWGIGYWVVIVQDYLEAYEAQVTVERAFIHAEGDEPLTVTIPGESVDTPGVAEVTIGDIGATVAWEGLEENVSYYGIVELEHTGYTAETLVYVDVAETEPEPSEPGPSEDPSEEPTPTDPTDPPTDPTAPTPTDDDAGDLPDTGGSIALWLIIVAIAAVLIGAGMIAARKRLTT